MKKIVTRTLGAASAVALSAGLTVAATAPAQADGNVWDRVAACESGGNWNISTGNGFKGGLQFTESTWKANGGSGSANQASRSQQIAVAKRTLASQGPGAWPVCGAKAGLTRSNGGATSGGSVSSRQNTHQQSTHNNRSTYNNNRSTYNNTSRSTYRNNKQPTHRSNNQSTHHSNNQSTYRSNNQSTQQTPRRAVRTNRSTTRPADVHTMTVQAGDTMAKIAARYGVNGGWQHLYQLNKRVVQNPNMIYIGQVLRIS